MNTRNITKWYRKAIELGLEKELDWYKQAHADTYAIAKRTDTEPLVVAAVIAILSPGLTWEINLTEAERVINLWKEGVPCHSWRCLAYGHNTYKVEQLLETNNFDLVSGPKVSAFFMNIVDPTDPLFVTVDRHALRVWLGERGAGHKHATKKQIREAQAAYQRAARRIGILPSQLQAITWCAYRMTGGDLSFSA